MGVRLHQVLVSPLVGGAGVVAIGLAGAARRHTMDCLAWVPGAGPASDALERVQARWRTYDLGAISGRALPHLRGSLGIWRGLVGVERPIVHVHNPLVYRFLAPALTAARARVVVHFHIEPSREEVDYSMRYPPERVITCARYIADTLREVLGGRRRQPIVTAVPNAIDTTRFMPGPRELARQRVGVSTERFVVLVMANLAPHKGQETILRAVHLLASRGVDVECWLAGEDRTEARPFEARLRSLVSELSLGDRVRFLGFRADAPDLLRAADAFALPSTHEGLPLSILEAQASHLPVIGSTIPGIREVVTDGETGFLVPADDFCGYADRVLRLLENSTLRRQLAAAGAAHVAREYTWPTLENRVFDIYRSML